MFPDDKQASLNKLAEGLADGTIKFRRPRPAPKETSAPAMATVGPETDRAERWAALLVEAAETLVRAAEPLDRETFPPMGEVRPRRFTIAIDRTGEGKPPLCWPKEYESTPTPIWFYSSGGHYLGAPGDRLSFARAVLKYTQLRPRAVLRALIELERAAQWCIDRQAGRSRAAARLLERHGDALAELDARCAYHQYSER